MSSGLPHTRAVQRDPGREQPPEAAPPEARPEERFRVRDVHPGIRFTITIAGSSSNAGKTWLCERILGALAEAGAPAVALKVTRTHLAKCPRENDACGVCDGLELPWRIVAERALLDVPRKDTGRYYAAGATLVRWLVVQPPHTRAGILAVLPGIPQGSILVAEGNSFADYAEGDLGLMMLSDRFLMKPSATYVFDRVQAFVCRPEAIPHFRNLFGEAALAGRPVLHPDEAAGYVLDRLIR